jgi:16S rRNA (guanine527-N7)-methyltransferase
MNTEFLNAISAHAGTFGLEVSGAQADRLAAYYKSLLEHNPVLHLVGPCTAEEFAVRHVLESLFISDLIPKGSVLADVGSGGGLPGIPLSIFRDDLKLVLIESKEKKAVFLEEAAKTCGVSGRVRVMARQFAEAKAPKGSVITARALDKFTTVLPKFLKWASGHKMILFGGPSLEEALAAAGMKFVKTLIPMSEQRFVFEVGSGRRTGAGEAIGLA